MSHTLHLQEALCENFGDRDGGIGGCWAYLPWWTHQRYIYQWSKFHWKQIEGWQKDFYSLGCKGRLHGATEEGRRSNWVKTHSSKQGTQKRSGISLGNLPWGWRAPVTYWATQAWSPKQEDESHYLVWKPVGIIKACKRSRFLKSEHTQLLTPRNKAEEADEQKMWQCLGTWLVFWNHPSVHPGPH